MIVDRIPSICNGASANRQNARQYNKNLSLTGLSIAFYVS